MTTKSLALTTFVIKASVVIYLIGTLILYSLSLLSILAYAFGNGWILGGTIALLNYGIIMFQAKRLQQRIEAKILTPYRRQGYSLVRFALSALGLLLSVTIKLNDREVFNVYTVFIAYLVISTVIFISGAQFKIGK
jgi:hypothetical protein